ncbi:hypothetical protein [Amycolatopsis sp. CA-230715]|uniref:hypothetical protein n=1 Tax=Amycolatopsis sp. CA-230715 TaxID=2745196 RepID=UPI001C00B128|nr:hypothetical protein [Amycolatopsis sp. CA-230715]QWF82773.1 hypothetical protein HUW46_06212 [Amycolatopsis sp. CA-230715]
MTDLEELKSAMAETEPEDGFRPPDLAKIMADGRRIRRRRRIAVGTGAVALTAAALVGISTVTLLREPVDNGGPALSVAKQPDAPVYEEAKTFWTDAATPDGWPIAMSFVHEVRPGAGDRGFPAGYFISVGRKVMRGPLTRDHMVPIDLTPGFHRIETNGLSCGYFVGSMRKKPGVRSIQATADGKYQDAKTEQWEAVPTIVLFWFSPGIGPAQVPNHRLEAYDSAGDLTVG